MRKGTAGTTIVSFALLLTALMGFVALGMEVGTWYLMRVELSKAVDAAALAGAANIASPNVNLAALAQDFGDQNFATGYLGTEGSGRGAVAYTVSSTVSQMTVTGSATGTGTISQIFGVSAIPVSAMGVAQKNEVELMLVLDCSVSMAGQPMTNLQAAATSFLGFFEPSQSEDMMGLVTFSTAASVKVPLETNFVSAIQGYVKSLSANGATNAEDAVAQAGAQLPVQTGTPNASWKQQYIVFFTDGEPTAFRSTFVHSKTSYDAVAYTTVDPYDSSNQWYDVGTYLASPTTGNNLSVNAVQTGKGQNETTCEVNEGLVPPSIVRILDELGQALRCGCPAEPLYCLGLLRHEHRRAAHGPGGIRSHGRRADGPEQRRGLEGKRGDDLYDRARRRRRHRYDLPGQSVERVQLRVCGPDIQPA